MAGRKTNLAASSYVTGNIDHKARGRWVDACADITVNRVAMMEDEELGLTLKACSRIKQNAKNALNKLNQQGGKNSWTRHMSEKKSVIQGQIQIIAEVYKILDDEFQKRMAADEMAIPEEIPVAKEYPGKDEVWKREHAAKLKQDLAAQEAKEEWDEVAENATQAQVEALVQSMPDDLGKKPQQEFTEPAGANLYELFCDTPQKELYELAYKGLEAGKSEISPEELANLREDVKVTNALCEELRQDAARRKELVEQLREGKKKAEVELKKLRRVIKGVQTEAENTANRLRKYTETKETT